MNKNLLRTFLQIGLIIILLIGFVLINEQITQNRKASFVYTKDCNKYAYQIESVNIQNNYLEIRGWFFEVKSIANDNVKEVEEKKGKLGIVLYDIVHSKEEKYIDNSTKPFEGISMEVEMISRDDIYNRYDLCDEDSKCGFIARKDISNLDLENGQYQVVIKPDKIGEEGINTSTYINKGSIQYTKPGESNRPTASDFADQRIISEGICILDNQEQDLYIYQYDNKLYYIAGSNYVFNADGHVRLVLIEYKLKKDNSNVGLYDVYVDNKSFDFVESEEKEVMKSTEKYRVSIREISNDSTVYILTGEIDYSNKDREWKWERGFRPVYSELIN